MLDKPTTSMQDKYTEQMIQLVQKLKSNSLAMAQILATDEAVLDDSHKLMLTNQSQLSKQTGRVVEFRKRTAYNTLWMWCVMLVVMMITIVMYFFIRLFPKR
jgi:ABC-type sugar transport system ATPase subunit